MLALAAGRKVYAIDANGWSVTGKVMGISEGKRCDRVLVALLVRCFKCRVRLAVDRFGFAVAALRRYLEYATVLVKSWRVGLLQEETDGKECGRLCQRSLWVRSCNGKEKGGESESLQE